MKKKHLLFKNYRNAISNAKSLYSPTPKNRQPKTTKIEFYIVEFNLIYMQIYYYYFTICNHSLIIFFKKYNNHLLLKKYDNIHRHFATNGKSPIFV